MLLWTLIVHCMWNKIWLLDCWQLECLIFHVIWFSASEPNLKVRSALKQKVMERRHITQSPILRRRYDKGLHFKRKTALSSMYSLDSFFPCDSTFIYPPITARWKFDRK